MTQQPLTFEFEIEIAAPPEVVWQAIATGNGISAWMMATDLEEQAGGSVVFHMGDVDSKGTVVSYEAPYRLVYEEPGWADLAGHGDEEVPPLVTEFVVEARSGGTCVVKVVSSAFGTGADWENEFFREMGKGWAPCFDVLKRYAERHAGLLATGFELRAEHPAPMASVRAFFDRSGELGAIETSGEAFALVGITDPVPGYLLLRAVTDEESGDSLAWVNGYLYGPDGPGAVDTVRENVRSWLAGATSS
jgi:uncharacterized protein YndB with AHSA1/START domain